MLPVEYFMGALVENGEVRIIPDGLESMFKLKKLLITIWDTSSKQSVRNQGFALGSDEISAECFNSMFLRTWKMMNLPLLPLLCIPIICGDIRVNVPANAFIQGIPDKVDTD